MDFQQDQEIIQEFLVETTQNLSQLDLDLVELEQRPGDPELLARVFRTFHTIKGTCSFLAFEKMQETGHVAENVLNLMRGGNLRLTPVLATLILETVDALRRELAAIEMTGKESQEPIDELIARLREAESAPAGLEALSAAQPAVSTAAPPNQAKQPAAADNVIHLDIALANELVNLVGELVLVRNQLQQTRPGEGSSEQAQVAHRLNLITSELQEAVMKTRMQPVSIVWNKLPRVVRDLGVSLGKQIQIEMHGAETEMDRSILEAIRDPLTHIVRNSCDHGIETPDTRRRAGKPPQGTLRLRAFHESGQVVIEVSDDGSGIPIEKVKEKALEKGVVSQEVLHEMGDRDVLDLIFRPGFSTAEQVSNVSGRGVGLDVVRSNLQKINGSVELQSRSGEGTTLRMRIPLTLAIIPGLMVISGGQKLFIPQVSLVELMRLEGKAVEDRMQWVGRNLFFRAQDHLRPVVFLNDVLGLASLPAWETRLPDVLLIAFVHSEGRQFGLVVDEISSTREIVVKPLGRRERKLGVYSGATILDDGRVALILDITGLVRRAGLLREKIEHTVVEQPGPRVEPVNVHTLLLFSAGRYGSLGIPLGLVGRLENLDGKKIEKSAGQWVVQYRGGILELHSLSHILDSQPQPERPDWNQIRVIVIQDGERSLGLVVDQVRDFRTGEIAARKTTSHAGLICSVTFDGKVCDLVDLPAVLRKADPSFLRKRARARHPGARLLLIDSGEINRVTLRHGLEVAGHSVVEASSPEEAERKLMSHALEAVVIVVESGQIPKIPGLDSLPTLVVTDSDSVKDLVGGTRFLCANERKAVLGALDQLLGPGTEGSAHQRTKE